jgi:hypothetical protein
MDRTSPWRMKDRTARARRRAEGTEILADQGGDRSHPGGKLIGPEP